MLNDYAALFLCFLGCFLISLGIGAAIGVYFTNKRRKKIGRINIDHSDNGNTFLFLEIDQGCAPYIRPGNTVLLDITEKNYLDDTPN